MDPSLSPLLRPFDMVRPFDKLGDQGECRESFKLNPGRYFG